jgi:hypothetical protein
MVEPWLNKQMCGFDHKQVQSFGNQSKMMRKHVHFDREHP